MSSAYSVLEHFSAIASRESFVSQAASIAFSSAQLSPSQSGENSPVSCAASSSESGWLKFRSLSYFSKSSSESSAPAGSGVGGGSAESSAEPDAPAPVSPVYTDWSKLTP